VSGIETLIPLLIPECPHQRFLFVRTPTGKTMGMETLENHGAIVESVDVYQQVPVETWPQQLTNELQASKIHGIVVTSQQIAVHAFRLAGDVGKSQTWFCLSQSVADSLVNLGCEDVLSAKEPSLESLVERIESHFKQQSTEPKSANQ
jgi:uroporphyrinogen-III synthase